VKNAIGRDSGSRREPESRGQCQGEEVSVLLDRLAVFEKLNLNLFYGLRECVAEFVKILLIKEDLMLLIFFIADAFALGDGDVEVLFGFCGFDIEEVRAFTCTDSLRKYLILVTVVVQGACPPLLCVSDGGIVSRWCSTLIFALLSDNRHFARPYLAAVFGKSDDQVDSAGHKVAA
jgi:hypothetical protein